MEKSNVDERNIGIEVILEEIQKTHIFFRKEFQSLDDSFKFYL